MLVLLMFSVEALRRALQLVFFGDRAVARFQRLVGQRLLEAGGIIDHVAAQGFQR